WPSAAHAALVGNEQYHPVSVLLDLVRAHVALELRGRVFNMLAAFCETGTTGVEENGVVTTEIVKLMWVHLERYEVLPFKADTGSGWRKSRGVPAELEEIEGPARQYPATIAFIHLLDSLVCCPETVPDNLDVLLKAEQREYADPIDRWRTTEACLCFVELVPEGYDAAIVQGMVQHPGFGVLLRVSADERVRDLLLGIGSGGVANMESGVDIQDGFIELLIPAARDLPLDIDIPTVIPT
ncbi:hypothetical protein FRC06_001248, partial [Ceratobasidium sp. 370]